jgi:hypothetical protein
MTTSAIFVSASLAKLRCVGGGPPFREVGRDVIYEAGDLDGWAGSVKSGPLASTSEIGLSLSKRSGHAPVGKAG